MMEAKNKDISGYGQAYQEVLAHVLKSRGFSPEEERQAAFNNLVRTEALGTLIDKVVNYAYKVTDDDIEAVKRSGFSEDQIFELVICAAIGQASRQYTNALNALAEVTIEKKGGSHAS